MTMSSDGKFLYGTNGANIILSSQTPSVVLDTNENVLQKPLSVFCDITANNRLFTNTSSIVLSNSANYSSTPIVLSTPVSQNIIVSVSNATITMPVMTTALSGININFRLTGSAMGTAITINAPSNPSIFIASGTSYTVSSNIVMNGISGTSLISDGVYWYQFP